MADEDRYANMAELFAATREGRDYHVHVRAAGSAVAIVAPHGGCIEPGTFELADAIAGGSYNFYCFEARTDGLHVTSHHFDDPDCIELIKASHYVITVHGCKDSEAIPGPDLTVAIGGRDTSLGALIQQDLEHSGFAIGHRPELAGVHPGNICNRGCSGVGVQLELSWSLRERLRQAMPHGSGGLFSRFAGAIDRAIQRQIGQN